jgi:hypothetical protein
MLQHHVLGVLLLLAGEERGNAYYTSAVDGSPLAAWPKIRTGMQQRSGGGGNRGGKRYGARWGVFE